MSHFIVFLEENFLATVIMVTSFIVDLFALAKNVQKDGSKKTWHGFIATLSVIFLISIGYLAIQYSAVQSSTADVDNVASGENLNDSHSSKIDDNANMQVGGEYHGPEVEKGSDIVSEANPNKTDSTDSSKIDDNTQIQEEYNDSGPKTGNDSVAAPNIWDSTQKREQENFKPATITGPYNSSNFTLDTPVAAGQMTINGYLELFGICQDSQEEVVVELIDYNTNQIIDVKSVHLGNTITFSDIPDGTYYYVINCTGYKETLSPDAFILERNANLPENDLPWFAVIEPNDNSYSIPFTVQMQTAQGEILKNASVEIGAIDAQNPYPNFLYPMKTDEQGYLTSWENINGVDYYHIVEFRLASGYCFEVSTTDGSFGKVDVQGNLGVCIITNS